MGSVASHSGPSVSVVRRTAGFESSRRKDASELTARLGSLKFLLLDDAGPENAALRRNLITSLSSALLQIIPCAQPPPDQAAWRRIAEEKGDVVFFIVTAGTTERWLASLRERDHLRDETPAIAIVGDDSPLTASALLQAGVSDFVMPLLSSVEIAARVLRLLQRSPGVEPARRLAAKSDPPTTMHRLVGGSPAFEAELNKLPLIAGCDAGVLIQGETGTGKEVFARAIHNLSPRANRPFVAVNCGSIPVDLIESELFGHERGAFTGAHARLSGLIAEADGGTLFLDEIASLPLIAQVKLLRFLQEKEYRPLGSSGCRVANVRIAAAANANLEREVTRGSFRQDLFYRLNVIRVTLPPLRERRADVPLLARHFALKYAERFGKGPVELSTDAIKELQGYEWPGNVRELENTIERAIVFCTESVVLSRDLALPLSTGESQEESFHQAKARTVARFERSYIENLLAAHGGNISSAARCAGKNRRAFWELMRKHRIQVDRFRSDTR